MINYFKNKYVIFAILSSILILFLNGIFGYVRFIIAFSILAITFISMNKRINKKYIIIGGILVNLAFLIFGGISLFSNGTIAINNSLDDIINTSYKLGTENIGTGIIGTVLAYYFNLLFGANGSILAGVVVLIIIIYIIFKSYKKQAKQIENEILKDIEDFESKMKNNGLNVKKQIFFKGLKIFIDDVSNKWAIYHYKLDIRNIYSFSDLIDFEIIENGSSVIQGKVTSTLVGGFLLGGIGALAGANSKKTISNVCESLILKIYINDLENSNILIDLIDYPIQKNSDKYRNISNNIDEIVSVLKFIREHNRQEERKENKKVILENVDEINTNNANLSSIIELAKLKDSGIITQEEFEESKKKILNKL